MRTLGAEVVDARLCDGEVMEALPPQLERGRGAALQLGGPPDDADPVAGGRVGVTVADHADEGRARALKQGRLR